MAHDVADGAPQRKRRGNPALKERGTKLRDRIRREIFAALQPGDALPKAAEIAAAIGLSDSMGSRHRRKVVAEDGWRLAPHPMNPCRMIIVARP